MDPATIRRAREIFEGAAALADADRPAFLRSRCGEDTSLRAFVEQMLLEHSAGGSGPLDLPVLRCARPAGEPAREFPSSLGPYELVRILGEGGMAVVYEARQQSPSRTVAVKVLRPGVVSPELLRRFRHEIDVLGGLRHEGIAHLYDAAVAEISLPGGAVLRQPYYAMELIRGEPLCAFADSHRLTTRERLELFARVCDAVQYAHQRGVIHRDLKPANILVESGELSSAPGGEGAAAGAVRPSRADGLQARPRILDFGVARVVGSELGAGTMNTEAGRLIGTLAYMSPEQVGGQVDQTDTRSDVYALGVILYELLAGRLPLDVDSTPLPEAIRRVREEEPVRLGRVERSLRGDVETIVARAMDKDRERRYASAHELGEDIRRHLRGEAIEARRDSAVYVLHRGLRRYRGLVAGVLVAIAGLAAFAGYASLQATRFRELSIREGQARVSAENAHSEARTSESRALAEAATTRRVNDFLKGVIELANPGPGQGYELTLTDLLDEATRRLADGALRADPAVEAEVRRTLGNTYNNLEILDAAAEHRRWLVEHVREASGPKSRAYLKELEALGHTYVEGGYQPQGQAILREALALSREIHGPGSFRTLSIMNTLGNSLFREGRLDEALALHIEAAEGMERLFGKDSLHVGPVYFNIAGVYRRLGRMDEAEAAHLRAVTILTARDPESQTTIRCRWYYARYYLHQRHGLLDEAERYLRETIQIATGARGAVHPETLSAQGALASVLIDKGDSEQAERLLREAVDSCRQLRSWVVAGERGLTLELARLQKSRGDHQQAAATLRVGIERLDARARGSTHNETFVLMELLAEVERDRGNALAAAEVLQQCADRLVSERADDPRIVKWREEAAALRASGR